MGERGLNTVKEKKRLLSGTQILALSFLGVILVGALLLCLPISSRSGEWTGFFDACFTATSATCVTGLVVFDTYTYWSLFGQLVILLMIQIGGLGLMTLMALFALLARRHIGLAERRLVHQTAGHLQHGGMSSLLRHILCGTLIMETLGTAVLSLRFCPQMGWGRGLYNAAFHSISAFCNAGFDLMGRQKPFASLTGYATDPLVSLTVCALVVIGGIGFVVWADLLHHRWHFRQYSLHSKIVLTTTAVLLLTGWISFYFLEADHSMSGMSHGERILASLFQSVTTRTAGYNSVDQQALSNPGSLLTVCLMFIGGSPGSTAGGIKTMTVALTVLSVMSIANNRRDPTVFRRRIEEEQVKQALGILAIYAALVLASVTAISIWEPKGMRAILFEVVSALGTVGLTVDGSGTFTAASRVILMLLMYIGRIGGLSLVLILAEKKGRVLLDRPVEKILIG